MSLPVRWFVHLEVRTDVRMDICLSVRLSVHLCVRLHARLFIITYAKQSTLYSFIQLLDYPSVRLSIFSSARSPIHIHLSLFISVRPSKHSAVTMRPYVYSLRGRFYPSICASVQPSTLHVRPSVRLYDPLHYMFVHLYDSLSFRKSARV